MGIPQFAPDLEATRPRRNFHVSDCPEGSVFGQAKAASNCNDVETLVCTSLPDHFQPAQWPSSTCSMAEARRFGFFPVIASRGQWSRAARRSTITWPMLSEVVAPGDGALHTFTTRSASRIRKSSTRPPSGATAWRGCRLGLPLGRPPECPAPSAAARMPFCSATTISRPGPCPRACGPF
jgi:hypothetical protein